MPCSFVTPAAAGFCPPKDPISTFFRERFIALHMSMVRMVPAEPTRIPPVSITGLLYKKPPNAAATPVNELSRDITTGISAPPIGITNKMPYKAASASML